jgi:hypothetical protein
MLVRESSKDLAKCLQYPRLELPEGYLLNWEGNDPGDHKGKGARRP